MKPLYNRDGISLYCGDCREVLPSIDAGSVDVAIADPPYGETSLKWDRRVPGWATLIEPLLSRAGSLWCFGAVRFFMSSAKEFRGWQLAQELVWEKQNGSSGASDRFKRVHELIAHFYPTSSSWRDLYKAAVTTPDATARTVRRKRRPIHWGQIENTTYRSVDGGPRLQRSVLKVRNCHGRAVHPTQKPEGIVEPLLRYSCQPGGLVLDPFAGSGTTLVVAKQLGLRAIGIELNPEYCELAIERLVQTLPLGSAA